MWRYKSSPPQAKRRSASRSSRPARKKASHSTPRQDQKAATPPACSAVRLPMASMCKMKERPSVSEYNSWPLFVVEDLGKGRLISRLTILQRRSERWNRSEEHTSELQSHLNLV